jgi:GntR family transcriptional regulator, vanillate catabolism transcriptional regulator
VRELTIAEAKSGIGRTGRKLSGRTRAMSVTEKLRNQIMLGHISPGMHLHEVQLADDLDVSRTPIRAALTTLAQEGLVTYQPNKGYEVRPFTSEDVAHAYDVRAALEGAAARLVAEKGLPDRVRAVLEDGLAVVDGMLANRKLSDANLDEWRDTNRIFHNTICDTTGNRFLKDSLVTVQNIPMVSNSIFHWFSYERVRQYHMQHHCILDAIINRQGSRAESLMKEHIYIASCFITSPESNSKKQDPE